jgi:hypothetical protein
MLKYFAVSTKLRFALIALLTAFLICQTATAQTIQQGRIFRDTTGATFIYGLQPGEPIQAASDFAPARYVTSNPCGLLIIKRSKTRSVGKIRIEGATIDPNTLPIQLVPSCQGGQLEETRSVPFKTATGDVVLPKVVNRRYQISTLDRPPLRVVKANSCGFLRFPAESLGDQPALPTNTGGMARFKVSTLPLFPQLLCQRKKLYIPANFPPPLATSIAPFNPDQWQPSSEPSEQGSGSPGGSGSPSGGDQPPTISPIASQTFTGTNEKTISFTISDPDTPLDQIQLTSNIANFLDDFEYGRFGGTGANRTFTVKPKRSSSGLPLQISASDGKNSSTPTTIGYGYLPAPPVTLCRDSGLTVPDLRPGKHYMLGFDDAQGTYYAAANENGIARFENVEFPEPFNSDEVGRRAIVELDPDFPDWTDRIQAAPYLANIPGC